jgi:hypothetical protein
VNLNRTNMKMALFATKAEALFLRIVELDPKFYNGGAHLALGMLYTVQGESMMKGGPEKGKAHFEKAIEVTGGKFLMPKVMMARFYGGIMLDRKFFHDQLVEVTQTSPAIMPEERLANELAHVRAWRYLEHEKELF